jgi:hypothetical protein
MSECVPQYQVGLATGLAGTSATEPGQRALLGQGAVLIWNDVAAEGREQFYAWHDKEHIPERLALPGFLRGRRLVCAGHTPEWLTIYEADGVEVLTSPEYLARLNQPTPATQHTLQFFRNTSRVVCKPVVTTGTSSGGHILAMRISVPSAASQAMCELVSNKLFPRAMALTSVVACHLFSSDQAASYINTAESATRTFDVPSWVILVEATTHAAAEAAKEVIVGAELSALGVAVRPDVAVYALEICRMGSRCI